MPQRQAERRALTRRYQNALILVTARATPVVASAWQDLTSYRDPDIEAFTAATAPIASAAKAAAATLTTGYYSALLAAPAPPINPDALAAEFYARKPFLATWKALNDGQSLEGAAAIGLGQAEAATANLVTSTARQAGDAFTSQTDGASGRVMRVAEITCCPWCAGLDGTTWPSAEAMDFGHDNCHCVPEPIG